MKKVTLIIIMSLFVFSMTNIQSCTNKTNPENQLDSIKQTNDLEVWKIIYQKYFNIEIDISDIVEREGKWPIIVAEGIKIQTVFDALPFAKRKYINGNLDKTITSNDRISDKDYIVYVNQNIEADEKFKNKSANDLKKMNHKGITLLERLLLELYYFEKTGKFLDVNNITLCSGSRFFDGDDVPDVHWDGGKLRVRWYGSLDSWGRLRSREVVSM